MYNAGPKLVHCITGRGNHSPDGISNLRAAVHIFLQRPDVVASYNCGFVAKAGHFVVQVHPEGQVPRPPEPWAVRYSENQCGLPPGHRQHNSNLSVKAAAPQWQERGRRAVRAPQPQPVHLQSYDEYQASLRQRGSASGGAAAAGSTSAARRRSTSPGATAKSHSPAVPAAARHQAAAPAQRLAIHPPHHSKAHSASPVPGHAPAAFAQAESSAAAAAADADANAQANAVGRAAPTAPRTHSSVGDVTISTCADQPGRQSPQVAASGTATRVARAHEAGRADAHQHQYGANSSRNPFSAGAASAALQAVSCGAQSDATRAPSPLRACASAAPAYSTPALPDAGPHGSNGNASVAGLSAGQLPAPFSNFDGPAPELDGDDDLAAAAPCAAATNSGAALLQQLASSSGVPAGTSANATAGSGVGQEQGRHCGAAMNTGKVLGKGSLGRASAAAAEHQGGASAACNAERGSAGWPAGILANTADMADVSDEKSAGGGHGAVAPLAAALRGLHVHEDLSDAP